MVEKTIITEQTTSNDTTIVTVDGKKLLEISKNKKRCKFFLEELEVVYLMSSKKRRCFEIREEPHPYPDKANEGHTVKEVWPLQNLNIGIYSIIDWNCEVYSYRKNKAINTFWHFFKKRFSRVVIKEDLDGFKIKIKNSCLMLSASALVDLQKDLQKDVEAAADILRNSLLLSIQNNIEKGLSPPSFSSCFPKVVPTSTPKRLISAICQQLAAVTKQNINLNAELDSVLLGLLPTISRHSKQFPSVRHTVLKESIGLLISKFEEKLAKKTGEAEWQKIFEDNKEILGMVLGLPVSFVSGTTSIGANGIEGNGEKITDFLVKTKVGGTFGLIEIKTADIAVVKDTPYRRNVFGLHPDIHDAVAQVLHQKEQFLLNFNMKKSSDIPGVVFSQKDHPVGISCVVVAGRYPEIANESGPTSEELYKRQGFERGRSAFNGVKIVTFDEVLAGLHAIASFIK